MFYFPREHELHSHLGPSECHASLEKQPWDYSFGDHKGSPFTLAADNISNRYASGQRCVVNFHNTRRRIHIRICSARLSDRHCDFKGTSETLPESARHQMYEQKELLDFGCFLLQLLFREHCSCRIHCPDSSWIREYTLLVNNITFQACDCSPPIKPRSCIKHVAWVLTPVSSTTKLLLCWAATAPSLFLSGVPVWSTQHRPPPALASEKSPKPPTPKHQFMFVVNITTCINRPFSV